MQDAFSLKAAFYKNKKDALAQLFPKKTFTPLLANTPF